MDHVLYLSRGAPGAVPGGGIPARGRFCGADPPVLHLRAWLGDSSGSWVCGGNDFEKEDMTKRAILWVRDIKRVLDNYCEVTITSSAEMHFGVCDTRRFLGKIVDL